MCSPRDTSSWHARYRVGERLKLAMSVLHCLPATWAESDEVLNGTVLRDHTLGAWSEAAGFTRREVLAVEHPFWRFHRLG